MGCMVLIFGIILIPYPGPGWLVVFAGLAILATEFVWARRVLSFVRQRYAMWDQWLKRQNLLVRIGIISGTACIVLTTLWLLNIFGLIGSWIGINDPRLASPFFS